MFLHVPPLTRLLCPIHFLLSLSHSLPTFPLVFSLTTKSLAEHLTSVCVCVLGHWCIRQHCSIFFFGEKKNHQALLHPLLFFYFAVFGVFFILFFITNQKANKNSQNKVASITNTPACRVCCFAPRAGNQNTGSEIFNCLGMWSL